MASSGKGEKSAIPEEKLKKIIDNMFSDEVIKNIGTECQFYRAVYDIMIEMNDEIGALQVKVPSKEEIDFQYKKYKEGDGKIKKDDLRNVLKNLLKPESFSVGSAAAQAVMWIFGAPIGALLAKKVVPGGARVSDDVVLPIATSIAVAILAATHKL